MADERHPNLGRRLTAAEAERVREAELRRHEAEARARRVTPEAFAPEAGDEPTGRHSILPEVAQLVEHAVARAIEVRKQPDRREVRAIKTTPGKRLLQIAALVGALGTVSGAVYAGAGAAGDLFEESVTDTLVETGLKCPPRKRDAGVDDLYTCEEIPQQLRGIRAAQSEQNRKLDALLDALRVPRDGGVAP